jgi:N-acetylneuraminic acid mutarotase
MMALAGSAHVDILWRSGAPMPLALAGGASGMVGGELVVAGGTRWENGRKLWLKRVDIYSPERNRWRTGPELPYALAYGGSILTPDGGLEIFGGADGATLHRECWKLDAAKRGWTMTGTLPADLLFAAAAAVDDQTWLIGGCADAGDLSRCRPGVFLRDRSGRWHTKGSMPRDAGYMGGSAVLGNYVYLFGGCSAVAGGGLVNLRTSYRFDTRAGAWQPVAPLPCALRGVAAAGVRPRFIYLIGGYGTCGGEQEEGFRAAVHRYDAVRNSYAPATPLPAPLMTDFRLAGNALYGAGGEDGIKSRSGRTLIGNLR